MQFLNKISQEEKMNQNELKERVAREEQRKIENLVDLLLKTLFEDDSPEIKTLVGHRFPDDDTWLCLWMAKKFIPKVKDAEIMFVNAGQCLLGKENDPSVLYFDTGGGQYDQHGKGLRKSSSAKLLTEKLELSGDPGLKPLLEMVVKVDNIEPVAKTDIHFLIEGYPRCQQFRKPHSNDVEWSKVQERVFEIFDVLYGQETSRIQNLENFKKHGAERTTLPNGIKVAAIFGHPEYRELAFEEGATVVIWTRPKGKNHFFTGIQVNRECNLFLDNVVAALRDQEAKARQTNTENENLRYIGRKPNDSWYLHDSKRLILNGSHTWEPSEEEYTKLFPRQIVGLVNRVLSTIPPQIVASWNGK